MEQYLEVSCDDCLDAGLIEKSMFGQTWVESCHCQASAKVEDTSAFAEQQ